MLIVNAPAMGSAAGPDGIPANRLLLWFDGNRSIDGLADNTSVSAATDLSTNEVMSSTSPNRPVFQLAEFGADDGLAFPSGDGGLDFLRMTRRRVTQGFSCFATLKGDGFTTDTSAATTGNAPMTIVGDTHGSFCLAFGFNGNNVTYVYKPPSSTASAVSSSGLALLDGTVCTVAVSHDSITGQVKLYANGAVVATGTRTFDRSNSGFDRLGAGNGGQDGFVGTIAECFAWDCALSDATVSQLHTRASALWT
jgi:hypothetical protein